MIINRVDVVIIGGGPGGYVAAIRAAQLGFSVLCVDKRSNLGGTCLNEGCIPSKALLHSSAFFEKVRREGQIHGLTHTAQVDVNLAAMIDRKDQIVQDLAQGIDFLFRKNKITRVVGQGRLMSAQQVAITHKGQESVVEAKKAIILATGSEPIFLKGVEVDEERILSSAGVLNLQVLPKRMMIGGGGYIGLEMGSVFRRLGVDITVVECGDRIVPSLDQELGQALHQTLAKQGLKICLSTKIHAVSVEEKGVDVTLAQGENFANLTTENMDILLLCLGRRPLTRNLGLEGVNVQCDTHGRVCVDERFETTVPGIYAIGDLIPGPMLAHKAQEEGVAVAEILAGQAGHVNYSLIPSVIYTKPEVASVGLNEEQVQLQGIPYKVGKFPFSANSRARVFGDNPGWVKILSHQDTDQILGTHIIGPEAGTLIGQMVLAQSFSAASEDVARTCHAHPTLNEALQEAALAVDQRSLHS